ncbi:MAG: aminoglycoside phosphotransferase family protein [Thermosynechococcaceae cyanobacterium]
MKKAISTLKAVKRRLQRKPVTIGTPTPEIDINLPLVTSLLKEQHPDLAHLPIQYIGSGWDNTMFRLGERLLIRLPHRAAAAPLIEREQTWLPLLSAQLPIAVPVPYRLGKPGQDYPWCWSVLPWLAGVTADKIAPHANQAKPFASFLRALHLPAPQNAPVHAVRGVPLKQQRLTAVKTRMRRLEVNTKLITPKIKLAWKIALKTPIDVQPKWLHGDLHARNILVENGVITGIIDWSDMTSGDIATDLAAIWTLFSEKATRKQVIAEYADISAETLQRAKGWAILFGVVLLDTGLVNNPKNAAMGKEILSRIDEDESVSIRDAR